MNRSIAGFLIAIVVVPLALLTIASRSSASSARTTQGALVAPAAGLGVAPIASEDTAVFAGGCFWGIEAVFEHIKGVKSAVSGYSGGNVANPSYEQVSSGDTGHAESVEVVYDPSQVSYSRLLQIFFSVALDPTQLNRQGPDVGTQYRSVIFYKDAEQQRAAENYIKQLTDAKTFSRPIMTRVEKLRNFYPAEAYHQDYLAHHPNQLYIVINDKPKVEALRKEFPSYYRE
jgi:peptide-methionine (S)-S-oxide reductase